MHITVLGERDAAAAFVLALHADELAHLTLLCVRGAAAAAAATTAAAITLVQLRVVVGRGRSVRLVAAPCCKFRSTYKPRIHKGFQNIIIVP
jgi:hypothetical protein